MEPLRINPEIPQADICKHWEATALTVAGIVFGVVAALVVLAASIDESTCAYSLREHSRSSV